MEKGIDKSAQRALEQYPIEMYEDVGWRCADKNEYKRQYFVEGYHQAEKDNELTWEDLKTMVDISDSVYAECDVEMFDEKEYYQEILKRFKERKEK